MRIVMTLQKLGGAARRSELLAAGVSRGEIHSALKSGVVKRPFRGCLTLPTTSTTRALASYFNARITCISAVGEYGLRVLDHPQVPHLEVDGNRAGHRDASLQHTLVRMHRSYSHEAGRLLVSPTRAIDVASTCVTPLAQLMMVDHALAKRKLARQEIADFTVTTPPIRRWLMEQADLKSGSVSETSARIALKGAGLRLQT